MKLYSTLAALTAAFLLCSGSRGQTLGLSSTQTLEDRFLINDYGVIEIDLADYFTIDGVTGQIVQLDFTLGTVGGVSNVRSMNIEMLPDDAPNTVENFMKYVDGGLYDNTIIHRSVVNFAIQGGGFTSTYPLQEVADFGPVVNEFSLSNTLGTLAMAKLGDDPDSATNQFFINLGDNSANLDNQNGGFTVFSRVIGAGMQWAFAIESVPTWDNVIIPTTTVPDGIVFNDIPLLGSASDPAAVEFFVTLKDAKRVVMYPDAGGSESMISFAVENSAPNVAAVGLVGTVLTITPNSGATGTAAISVTVSETGGGLIESAFDVTTSLLPVIYSQPLSRAVEIGRPVTLTVGVAGGEGATYQWNKNGEAILGAIEATLAFEAFTAEDGGAYTLAVTNAEGTVTSAAANLSAIATSSRLVNVSARGLTLINFEVLTVGFSLEGDSGNKELLARGLGPALEARGLAANGLDTDPRLSLVPNGGTEETNDNWETGTDLEKIAALTTLTGAPALTASSLDATLTGTYPEGVFTLQALPKAGVAEGVVLAEVFDADADPLNSDLRMVNVLSSAFVATGEGELIVGFWLRGGEKANVLIRASGPNLTQDTIASKLQDPMFTLYNAAGEPLGVFDNWEDNAYKSALAEEGVKLGLEPLSPNGLEAAAILTLDPGGYTVVVKGVGETTGFALVEVNEIR